MKRIAYRDVPSNHMKWWTKKEDEKLWDIFLNTRFVYHNAKHNKDQTQYWTPIQLGEIFGRSPGAILKRLDDIGAIEYKVNGYYVVRTNDRYSDVGYVVTHSHREICYPRWRG